MKGKMIYLVLAGVGLAAAVAGVFLASESNAMGLIWLTVVGFLVLGIGIDGLLPKQKCPTCGHRFRVPRFRRVGTGNSDTFPCPKCGAMVPLQ